MKKFVLTSLLFGLLTSVSHAECTLQNPVAELKQNDPATYRALQAEAAQYANPEGVFWEVSRESTPFKSYVFGTLHKADPRILDLPSNVEAALNSVDALAVEIEDANDQASLLAVLRKDPQLLFQPQGESLADDLSPETVASIDAYLNDLGMDFDMLSTLQPWLGVASLSFTKCDIEWGGPAAKVLDAHLVDLAKSKAIEVVSLESIESQLQAIASINEQMFIRSIEDVAHLYDEGIYDAVLHSVSELYLAEQIGMIIPVQMHFTKAYDGKDEDMAEFQNALLDVRNEQMVKNASELMKEKSTFVAVGALHLIGETGLVEGLRNAGFKIRVIPLER